MVSTFVPVLIAAVAYFLIFAFLRKSQRRYYAPRTYLGSLREQYVASPLVSFSAGSDASSWPS